MLALEPFFMEFISGVESVLSARSIALTLQLVRDVAEEVEVHRRWWAERRVDGVIVLDPRVEDPRVPEVVRLNLPAVVVGGPVEADVPSVWHDEVTPIHDAVRYLAALGHTHVARVAGVPEFVHTVVRSRAFREAAAELGLEADVVDTDYTPESGTRATRTLLSRRHRPTAIVYDSDILAVTGLGVAQQMGLNVPADLAVVAWDDSLICEVVHPPLTAVRRDNSAYGAAVARRLLAEIDGTGDGNVEARPGELTPRGSTARRAAASG
jgi:DNA-binding LacI/PurR family transcriptional regulator